MKLEEKGSPPGLEGTTWGQASWLKHPLIHPKL